MSKRGREETGNPGRVCTEGEGGNERDTCMDGSWMCSYVESPSIRPDCLLELVTFNRAWRVQIL